MFRCCKKKAIWYLDRNLGTKVSENPLIIQLTFVPKGIGHIDDPYFLQEMHNRCVVCGSEDACVYIWNKEKGDLVAKIGGDNAGGVFNGHTQVTNCAHWSPTDNFIFATASDDHTIRVWGLEEM